MRTTLLPLPASLLLLLLLLLTHGGADGYVTPESSAALLRPGGARGYPGQCPCANASLCEPVTGQRFADGKQLFVFHVAGEPTNFDQWRHYDFSRITVIAMWEFPEMGAELLCHAHSLGIRVVLPSMPPAKVYNGTNETKKLAWADNTAATVKSLFADGINMDTEDAIPPGDRHARDGLTDIAKRARVALNKVGLKSALVTFDVGWMPGVDGRFYDYQGLAEVCDYLVVMAYDMASYIWGACLATPNSPPPQVMQGVLNYLALVPPDQLVLAVPWYGRRYRCANGTATDARLCPMAKPLAWRDCNCTDSGAEPVEFGAMASLTPTSSSGVQRDAMLQTPWMNFAHASSGAVSQLWYDDIESLSIKYTLAAAHQLLGVGMWAANMLDYGKPPWNGTDTIPQATRDMWTAISTVPFPATRGEFPEHEL